jgi:hypothetical protein
MEKKNQPLQPGEVDLYYFQFRILAPDPDGFRCFLGLTAFAIILTTRLRSCSLDSPLSMCFKNRRFSLTGPWDSPLSPFISSLRCSGPLESPRFWFLDLLDGFIIPRILIIGKSGFRPK